MAATDSLTRVTRNGQVTLPARVRRTANIEVGDYVAVRVTNDGVLLVPQKLIDKSQAYYWTEEWQKGEREADEDIKAGRYVTFDSAEEAVAHLRERVRREDTIPG